ncbi:MAG: amino acid ABC transporter substrate-binding protein [Geothrix sp.]|uniref:hypothetical protein n=1 Tax=Geothrix sp. TaxID=1962974 RepID=UPI001856B49F|nr:hypothetical protein [Geothrix sp.]NWJ42245.1 amino acid ABC transporter substrate-binding protein [Geothrix sp.]WIL19788.1 MAG: hypothetical protein QOZ81_002321 [Geothrix sp.]
MPQRPPLPRSRSLLRLASAPLLLALLMGSGPQAPDAALRLGERMYRDGVLPSGEPMTGTVRGDVPVAGTAFACTGCHLQGGLGSFEGGVATPPTNAEKLFRPWFRFHPNLVGGERKVLPESIREELRRPAYTDAALARALTEGVDPAGRVLNDVMPRYALGAADVGLLVQYLKRLGAEPSPGVTPTVLKFATIVTDEVSAEDRQDFLQILTYRFAIHNRQGVDRDSRGYRSLAAREGALAYRDWSLTVWKLKGPASGWAAQLAALYRKEPVFAIVSGLSYQPWGPIHAFCEAEALPCILPLTDLPQTSGPGWYTLYFSKGPFQEGEAAAAFLADQRAALAGRPILQVVADSREARALAEGFDSGWEDHGQAKVQTLHLRRGQRLDPGRILGGTQGDPILLLWTGAEAYPALTALTRRPTARVMMASSLLGKRVWDLPQEARDRTWLTYPFRLFRPPASMKAPEGTPPETLALVSLVAGDTHRRVRTRSFAVMKSLTEALTRMERNFYRDTLLDAFGMMMDDDETDYERLSFGPGQRFASKGCYVVKLPRGRLHGFVKQSDWVIH